MLTSPHLVPPAIGAANNMVVIAVAGGLALGLAIVFVLRSIESRKGYSCPQCGERIVVELMDASRCNSCGAPLQQEGR